MVSGIHGIVLLRATFRTIPVVQSAARIFFDRRFGLFGPLEFRDSLARRWRLLPRARLVMKRMKLQVRQHFHRNNSNGRSQHFTAIKDRFIVILRLSPARLPGTAVLVMDTRSLLKRRETSFTSEQPSRNALTSTAVQNGEGNFTVCALFFSC